MSDDLSKAEAREPGFYWVRATSGRPFEAACWRAEDNFWRFTDGSHMHASPNEIGPRIHAPDQPAQDDRAELIAAFTTALDYIDGMLCGAAMLRGQSGTLDPVAMRPDEINQLHAILATAAPNQGSQQ